MKKLLTLAVAFVIGIASLLAESTPVKYEGKNIGSIEWSYSIQTYESRAGSFTTITAENNTSEYVRVAFKTDAGGFESVVIPPYETKSVTIGTNKAATYAICTSASVAK